MKSRFVQTKFLEALGENPWISFACKKAGVSRATIYRWMKDIPDFKRAVDSAIKTGILQLGEMAEMGLAKKIKEGSWPSIKFYLEHRNPKYIPKRSVYVSPPEHIHSDDGRCERCGRFPASKEAEMRRTMENINKELKRIANPKTKEDRQEIDNLMKSDSGSVRDKPKAN